MTQAQNHDVLVLAGAGAAAFGAYQFLYKPWKAGKDAAAAALLSPGLSIPGGGGGGGGYSPYTPGGGAMVSSPGSVGPGVGTSGGSIKDPRVSPGGDVGQAMWRKGWTETQAKTRLDAIKSAYASGLSAIAGLQIAQQVNPAASGIPAAQAAIQQNLAAIDVALGRRAADLAAGDTVGAANWAAAAAAHQEDVRQLQARIAAASAPVDNGPAIAAYQGALAGLAADYMALTGFKLA